MTFDDRAIRLIHREAEGIPRLINLAADRALLAAYVDRTTTVRPAHVRTGLASLRGQEPEARTAAAGEDGRGARWLRTAAVALIVVLVVTLTVAAYLYSGWSG